MIEKSIEERFKLLLRLFYRYREFSRAGEKSIEVHNYCNMLLDAAERERISFVQQQNEDKANLMLAYIHMLDCMSSELRAMLLLHTKEYDLAWDCLIESLNHIDYASWAHPEGKQVGAHRERLQVIEKTIFPEQIFCSPQFVYGSVKCSVCGKELDICDHIEREVYMGKRCFPIIEEIEDLLEVSILTKDDPKDKRCRVGSYIWQGVNTNWMSQRVTPNRELPSIVRETSHEKVVFEIVWPERLNWWLAIESDVANEIINREPITTEGSLGKIIASERSGEIDWATTSFAIPKEDVDQFFIVRLGGKRVIKEEQAT